MISTGPPLDSSPRSWTSSVGIAVSGLAVQRSPERLLKLNISPPAQPSSPVLLPYRGRLDDSCIDYTPTGSMTLESEVGAVKREADKSYRLGGDRPLPDLAIEVVVTSGGIQKLKAYQRLQIPEVWFWEQGQLSLYALRPEAYEQISRSELLPGLDIDLLTHCFGLPSHLQSVQTFRQGL